MHIIKVWKYSVVILIEPALVLFPPFNYSCIHTLKILILYSRKYGT